MEQIDIFDMMPEDEAKKYKPIKSTDWKWTMANDYPKEKNGLKVFSCFACGGGSTMGYKLAGCEVIGCCEIDKKMNDVYVKNHHAKYNYLMDIRKFNEIPNEDLPEELFNLDILDGSPPCTTFSMAGDREESWGKKKKFRDGQAEQTLDDLSFVFIDTVAKLKPKVVIMENVDGILLGEAITYVQRIYKKFKDIGYSVKHYLLKGEYMGVPQTRHRVFFVATRLDFDFDDLDLNFNYEPITYGEIKSGKGKTVTAEKIKHYLSQARYGEESLQFACERETGKQNYFNEKIIYDNKVLNTIRACMPSYYRWGQFQTISAQDIIYSQTFPCDYNFMPDTLDNICYICGMSVPPIMIKRIVTRLIESGIFDYKIKEK